MHNISPSLRPAPVQSAAGVGLFLILVLLAAAYFFPWRNINWGSVSLAQSPVVVVTGSATERQQNQVAQFSAGVSAVDEDRDAALRQVNDTMHELVEQIKAFGIPDDDIKTENVSVYQGEETVFLEGTQRQRPGQWRVNNSVQIILRDMDRAVELTTLLSNSGATNVFGPNFMLDRDTRPEDALLSDAIENAREKAEVIAQSSDGRIGRVISVVEGVGSGPIMPFGRAELAADGMGGGPLEPGVTSVSKQVTVTFELITQ